MTSTQSPTVGQAQDPAQPLLSVRGLQLAYKGATTLAVAGVSFDVYPGEQVAIVGESGSGKTSVAKSIVDLLPSSTEVSADALRYDGLDLTALTPLEWRAVRGARIGLIPQDPSASLNPLQTVGAQVAEVLLIHGLATKRDARARAVELLADAGIPDAAKRAAQYPHQFSGGMRQRVLIAAALAASPGLIIADEPTSALDVTVQRQILDLIAERAAVASTSVLFITHDLGVAADRADRILVMQHGVIVEAGPAAQVLEDPQHPYTKRLVAAAPTRISTRLVPAHGALAIEPSRPVLEVSGLSKTFRLPGGARVDATKDVAFSIARGESYALVGESGSGKSTTARLALLLERPDQGSIRLDGVEVAGAKGSALRAFRRRTGLVHQDPYSSLDPRFTVADSIEQPLRAFGVGDKVSRRARVLELLDDVALPASFAERRSTQLSGGQRQRVAIARALALNPELIVLDEAVSALDVSVQAQILQLLVDLQAEHSLSYLFITHDLAVVRQIADRVGVLRRGELLEEGTVDAVFERSTNEYTRALVDAIPGGRPTERVLEAIA